MSYKIERGGRGWNEKFLLNHRAGRGTGEPLNDTHWTNVELAHTFEKADHAHEWVRVNKGEGQFTVIDSESGEQIHDEREGFDSTVRRYIDPTGGSYPGQSDWSKG